MASVNGDQKPSHQKVEEHGLSLEIHIPESPLKAPALTNGDKSHPAEKPEQDDPVQQGAHHFQRSKPTILPEDDLERSLGADRRDQRDAQEAASPAPLPSSGDQNKTPVDSISKGDSGTASQDTATLDKIAAAARSESPRRATSDKVERTARFDLDHQSPQTVEASMNGGEAFRQVVDTDLAKVKPEEVTEDRKMYEAKGDMHSECFSVSGVAYDLIGYQTDRRSSQSSPYKPRPPTPQALNEGVITDDEVAPSTPRPPAKQDWVINDERKPEEDIVEVIEELTPPGESDSTTTATASRGEKEPEGWEEQRARERSRLRRALDLEVRLAEREDVEQTKGVDDKDEERRRQGNYTPPIVHDIPERTSRQRTNSADGLSSTYHQARSRDRRRPESDIRFDRVYEPLPVRRPPPVPPSAVIRPTRSPSPPMYRRSDSDIAAPPRLPNSIYPIDEFREDGPRHPRRYGWDHHGSYMNYGPNSVLIHGLDWDSSKPYSTPLHRDPYSVPVQRRERGPSDLDSIGPPHGPYSVPGRPRSQWDTSGYYSAPHRRPRPRSYYGDNHYHAEVADSGHRTGHGQPSQMYHKSPYDGYLSSRPLRTDFGRDESSYYRMEERPVSRNMVRRERSISRGRSVDESHDRDLMVEIESRHGVVAVAARNSRPESPVQRDISSPVQSPPSLQKDFDATESSEWITYLKSKSLLPTRQEEINWSGKGQHVEFSKVSEIPLVAQKPLGHSANCLVEQCRFQRYLIARKTIQCSRRMTKEQALIEVEHLQRLRHPHIVQLIGSYVLGKKFAILLFPAADFNLDEFMEMCGGLEAESLERTSLLSFTSCLLSALAYVHDERIKHMDIKPKNILVRSIMEPLEPYRIYLADFGIAKSYKVNEDMETNGVTAFTRTYAAPEVALQETRGTRADIFSLGCVFTEMFTVLSDKTLESFITARQGGDEDDDSAFHSNLERVILWLASLNPSDTSGLISWPKWFSVIKQMLQEDPSDRPSAADLLKEFKAQKDCCSAEPASFDPSFHRPRPQERSKAQGDIAAAQSEPAHRRREMFRDRDDIEDMSVHRERNPYSSDSRRSRMRRHDHASYEARRPVSIR
ncbi:MAG: hypothetical protein M1835_004682 [Candelina submexicana]|nr:MAG: hypothetical protein M1835_004682 [Candelina submexicana]